MGHMASATRAGPPTGAPPKKMPTRTATAKATAWWCTMASSKTTWHSSSSSSTKATPSRPRPTRESSPTWWRSISKATWKQPCVRQVTHILWNSIEAEKGGYQHFMLKEIFEQPRAVRDTTLGRVAQETGHIFLDEMEITPAEYAGFKQVKIIACGTSWHAGLSGKFMIEKLARIPVEVDYGSEFRYRDPLVDAGTLTVVISQSGETADTLAAQREAKQKGSKTLAICNVIGSMITREAAGAILTHAGPEIGVASTKAFTGQLTALMLTAMYLGQARETLTTEE